MAYLVDLTHTCDQPGCGKPATVELRNRANAPLGRYCRRDGNRQLIRAKADEAASDARRA